MLVFLIKCFIFAQYILYRQYQKAYEKKYTMKQLWLTTTLTLLLTAATSCEKTQAPETEAANTPITLAPETSARGTKGAIEGTTLPVNYTIHLSSYFNSSMSPESSGDYFVDKRYNGSDGTWHSTPATYWPLGGALSFLAVAYDDNEAGLNGRVEWTKGNCTDGVEVKIPDGKCHDTEILFSSAKTKHSDEGDVDMKFIHAQSWLQFKLTSTESDIIRIDKLTILEAQDGGTLRITNGIYTTAEWLFRGYGKRNLNVPVPTGGMTLSSTPTILDILVPEQEPCAIEINYSIKEKTSGTWENARTDRITYMPSADTWYYGTRTIYNIRFSLTGITVNAEVKEWGADEMEIKLNV